MGFGRLRIAVIFPTLSIGGGNIVLHQYADWLARSHVVTKIIGSPFLQAAALPPDFTTLEAASKASFDVAIASWWEDLLALPTIEAGSVIHLLQGPEWKLYASDDPRARLIRELLRVPIATVGVSRWLAAEAESRGRPSCVVHTGIDKSQFHVDGPIESAPSAGLRILVEGPLGVWHKNVIGALQISRSVADETWLLTSTQVGRIPGIDRVFSGVPHGRVASIYRSCDVLLKLSFVEGLPLPPIEMFHTGGTAVVHDLPGHEDYAEHGVNCVIVRTGDRDEAIDALIRIRDGSALADLKKGALATAGVWPDPASASARFAEFVERMAGEVGNSPTQDAVREIGRLSTAFQREGESRRSGLPLIRHLRSARYAFELRRRRVTDNQHPSSDA